jgi:hypothetical protein
MRIAEFASATDIYSVAVFGALAITNFLDARLFLRLAEFR